MDITNVVSHITRNFDSYLGLMGISKYFESDEALFETLNQFIKSTPYLQPMMTQEVRDALLVELQYKYKVFCLPGVSLQDDYSARKWYSEALEANKITPTFWNRYASYLIDTKGFAAPVVEKLGSETLDSRIMNFLADPRGGACPPRRGLIIGDVQSGKTSTYIGLINKAADAGYKVFIILTGTIESLRQQTQERVDEGFVGIDMSVKGGQRVGVGLDNKQIMASSLTSKKTDFRADSNQIAMSLAHHSAVVFVIKKNTSVLTKLRDWLIELNTDPITGKINEPMLLIDDEADNASINTKKDGDPTKINGLIRELVNVFSISNYVGFTATPYANVFIDPVNEHEMFHHDLFPEDFIVALPTPSDYIGAHEIFDYNGRYHSQLTYITDAGITENDNFPFYYLHKRDWDGELPESVTDAIYAFYLANAIRDLRGDANKHRSMLINMSRFTDVQFRIRDRVEAIHHAAMIAIKYNLSKDFEKSMGDPTLQHLYRVWEEQYSKTEFSWDQIADVLKESVAPIEIKVVNSSKNSEKLVYPEDEALRVIAIGGLALSRGLTLEGLIISYFYRNTCTYDVLMQMGRWFGYRRKYDDLFRIWTSEESALWYAEIADATTQLKKDMNEMRRLEMIPRQFGIRVRDDSERLQITALNKMRNTKTEYEVHSFYGHVMETAYLSPNAAVHRQNFTQVCHMIQEGLSAGLKLERKIFDTSAERYIMGDVPKKLIFQMLSRVDVTRYNRDFDTAQITNFLASCHDPNLDKWDVVFIPGAKGGKTYNVCGTDIWRALRNNCKLTPEKLQIGSRSKLGGPRDGTAGLDNEQIELAEARFKDEYLLSCGSTYKGNTFTWTTWFKYVTNRKPLLAIYLIEVQGYSTQEREDGSFDSFRTALGENSPVVGFAIGFPQTTLPIEADKFRFKANRFYNFFEDFDDTEEGGDE